MIDFHTHILPMLDDGSESVEMSLRMLGQYPPETDNIFLTPHFYPKSDNPDDFLARRRRSAEKLAEALNGKKHPRLHLGAEVAYYEGIHNSSEIEKFLIGKTRLLLVEMPMKCWNIRMIEDLLELCRGRNIHTVMAHIDRYSFGMGPNRKLFEHYLENGGLVQVNCEAFGGFFSYKKVVSMIRSGMIHFIGSDAHNLTDRKPNAAIALNSLRAKGDADIIDCIVENENLYL